MRPGQTKHGLCEMAETVLRIVREQHRNVRENRATAPRLQSSPADRPEHRRSRFSSRQAQIAHSRDRIDAGAFQETPRNLDSVFPAHGLDSTANNFAFASRGESFSIDYPFIERAYRTYRIHSALDCGHF